jgi:HK97 family phage major capsid protein
MARTAHARRRGLARRRTELHAQGCARTSPSCRRIVGLGAPRLPRGPQRVDADAHVAPDETAVANEGVDRCGISHLAASAAYWIAAQADRVVVTPSGDIGHIGVITAHSDLTGAEAKAGVKTTGRGRGRASESVGTQLVRAVADWRRDPKHSGLPKGAEATLLADVPYGALFAATLTEDPASGGDLVIPDFRPGIVPLPTRPLVVADLIAPGTTESALVTYMVETAFTNAADTVAEGAVKPESTLTFDAVSDPVRKIAHWLPVTEEIVDDVPQMRSYVDARLRLGVQLTEDDQLLNGTTTAPDIVGIRNRTGLAADVTRTDPETNADAIARQIAALTTSSTMAPTGIVMHPSNWLTILLSKTTTGEYIGTGPFGRVLAPTLWNLPVAVTPIIPVGTALVGAFRTAAQIFRKGGINVAITDSHADYFIRNLLAIRAEERLALAVYRPGAFGEVVSLT